MSSTMTGQRYPDTTGIYNIRKRACWSCRYQLNDEATLFGVCTWFAHHRRKNKDIPQHIVDVGCKFHAPKLKALLPTEVKESGNKLIEK